MPYSPTSTPQFREIEQRANANGCTLRYTAGEYRLSHTETASVVYADDSLENVRGWLTYRPDLRGPQSAAMEG